MNALIEEALGKYLGAATGVKVWPEQPPENEADTFPAIVYQETTYEADVIHRGASGIAETRFQITCFARTYRECRLLAERARKKLSGFRGSWDGLVIGGVFVLGSRSVPERNPEAKRRDRYGRMFDVVINHREELPSF